jgi:anti-sigma factor RsiW
MKAESELNVQAYLDGELSSRQARKVTALIGADPEAKLLFEELKMAKTALAGNEMEVLLPENVEFYWSKIQREIQRAESLQPKPLPAFLAAWRRLLAPLAGAALIMFLTVYTFRTYENIEAKPHYAVVENLSEHTGAYSFRSQSQNMFVVWVYDRSQEANAESEPADEQVDQ